MRHGTIWINDYNVYVPQAEWGGFKQSGIGREGGIEGLYPFLETKTVILEGRPGRYEASVRA